MCIVVHLELSTIIIIIIIITERTCVPNYKLYASTTIISVIFLLSTLNWSLLESWLLMTYRIIILTLLLSEYFYTILFYISEWLRCSVVRELKLFKLGFNTENIFSVAVGWILICNSVNDSSVFKMKKITLIGYNLLL